MIGQGHWLANGSIIGVAQGMLDFYLQQAQRRLRGAPGPLAEDAFASTDLRRHREIVAEAHLIVTMTTQQKEMIGAYDEAQGRQIFTLHELAGEGGDVDDPFGQGEDRYRATKDEIKRCLELGVDRMLTLLDDRKEIPR